MRSSSGSSLGGEVNRCRMPFGSFGIFRRFPVRIRVNAAGFRVEHPGGLVRLVKPAKKRSSPRGLSPDDTLKFAEHGIERQHVRLVQGCRNDLWFEDFALPSAAVLDPGLAAAFSTRIDAPHRLRRGREKVPPVFETLLPRQSQTGFMHQGRASSVWPGFSWASFCAANRLSSSSISGNNLSAACTSPRSIACNTLVISHITGH